MKSVFDIKKVNVACPVLGLSEIYLTAQLMDHFGKKYIAHVAGSVILKHTGVSFHPDKISYYFCGNTGTFLLPANKPKAE